MQRQAPVTAAISRAEDGNASLSVTLTENKRQPSDNCPVGIPDAGRWRALFRTAAGCRHQQQACQHHMASRPAQQRKPLANAHRTWQEGRDTSDVPKTD
jgi:hypothetical protein